jgi:hypothetical protein
MRGIFITAVVVLGFAAGMQTAAGTPALPAGAAVGLASNAAPAASHKCGKGQHWVAAGYAKHGKYRIGHCAPN